MALGLAASAHAQSSVFSNQFSGSAASGWSAQGSASVAGDNSYAQLTDTGSNEAGSLFYTGSAFNSGNWTLTAEIHVGDGGYWQNGVKWTDPSWHGDGLTFTWLDATPFTTTTNAASTTELLGGSGGLLGLPTGTDVKGYTFEFDTHDNSEYGDPTPNPNSLSGMAYQYTDLKELNGTDATHVAGSLGTPGGTSVFSDAQMGPSFINDNGGWLPVSLTCTTSVNAQGVTDADFILAWGGTVTGDAGANDFNDLTNSYEFKVSDYNVYQDAYFGFTAGTGAFTDNHLVRDVTLDQIGGGSTPELQTWALLLPALPLSLRVCRRRRRKTA
jgi:hypothetical protein